jgi:uncharacterized protein YjcR
MHGGAQGSGAPSKNHNAVKHGLFRRDAISSRQKLRKFIKETRTQLAPINRGTQVG